MEIQKVRFTDPEFARCFAIRWEVFVREQQVPEAAERDEHDFGALHYLATDGGIALGTARVLPRDGGAKITRVAVVKAARGRGIGAALIRQIEHDVAAAQFLLDAQTHALAFYQRLGYAAYGEEFLEAGILHRHMRKICHR